MTEPTLEFIAQKIEQVLIEQASMRDDMRVLAAVTMRLDNSRDRDQGTMHDMLRELRAIREQIARMNDRVRKLEDAPP